MEQERLIRIRELVGEIRVKQGESKAPASVVLTINLCVPDAKKSPMCLQSRHLKTRVKSNYR